MLDGLGVIDISSKLNNLKTTYKNNSKDKVDCNFKDYLTDKVNNNSNEKANIYNNGDKTINEDCDYMKNDVVSKEALKKVSEKIESLLETEDISIENLNEDLQEIILLLLNILQTNLKDFNDEYLENYENIEHINNLDGFNSIVNDLLMKNKESILLNSEEFNLTRANSSLQNINSLLIKYLEKENSNKVSLDIINNGNFDEISESLFDEMKELLSSIPKDFINEVNNNLESNYSKVILNYLISETMKNVDESTSNKETIKKVDDSTLNKETMRNVGESASNKETMTNVGENTSNNLITSFNEVEATSSEENSININSEKNIYNNDFKVEDYGSSKEEDILKKILESDDKQIFSKALNYYTKLNKSNVIKEVVNEAVVINKDNINIDFIKNIKYMINNSMEELNVKVYPKELGEITIKLISEAGIMKAEIKATSKETYNLLNSNLNEIKNSLENQNIKIQEVNIGIYNEDTTFFSGEENSRKFYESKDINKINTNASTEEEEFITDILNEGNINFLA